MAPTGTVKGRALKYPVKLYKAVKKKRNVSCYFYTLLYYGFPLKRAVAENVKSFWSLVGATRSHLFTHAVKPYANAYFNTQSLAGFPEPVEAQARQRRRA